jgi:formate-dependent nitrite reductase membrane component NrfD
MKIGEITEFEEHGLPHQFTRGQILRMNIAAILVIAGTLILRGAIVYAGQLIKLSIY